MTDLRISSDALANPRRRHDRFTRAHPSKISTQRIDLSIVTEESIRVRKTPRWKSVRRKSRVNESDCAGESAVLKIAIERRDLVWPQHSLINHRPRGQARDVTLVALRNR